MVWGSAFRGFLGTSGYDRLVDASGLFPSQTVGLLQHHRNLLVCHLLAVVEVCSKGLGFRV